MKSVSAASYRQGADSIKEQVARENVELTVPCEFYMIKHVADFWRIKEDSRVIFEWLLRKIKKHKGV